MGLREHVEEAAEYLRGRMPFVPEAMVILGSGLGGLVDGLACAMRIPMREIPHWPLPSVPGHRGEAVWCEVGSTRALVLAGRAHLYEGFSPQQVALPVHTGASLGAKVLIVTNAAGGINPKFHPGDLMLVQDHINLMFRSPLVGTQGELLGPVFPEMSHAYSPELRALAKEVAGELGLSLREGVLVGVLGPSYETPAEVRMIRILGGDAVTMSTIPEVLAARQRNLEVLGISVITNAAGHHMGKGPDHEEVLHVADKARGQLERLLLGVLRRLGRSQSASTAG